ncbi:putative toxin-antitoxin system toxin component, PIN family [Candidatus Oscillochloris fontis]|uniref:putative toxin-antitoxin system toxin component, PIN family n=1 Tax=Candidatus Oscillochloris fontis TaxID=2496868 RepID=UPI001930F810|nr:putative toxin-antitoxin system toxin component, PIN family [Candidatus Oscillochloris fontis]
MTMIRCVFDTNVIVSALLFDQSTPAQAIFYAVQHGIILLSAETLAELTKVIRRKKFEAYIPLHDREHFLTKFVLGSEIVTIHEQIDLCRDAKDNKFLEVAVNGNATVLVSGDEDLTVLHPFRNIPIISPQAFLQHYGG